MKQGLDLPIVYECYDWSQKNELWRDTNKAEDNTWHLVFLWDLGIFSLI